MCEVFQETEYTYEYFLQDNVCRLCWNKDCLNIVSLDNSVENSLVKNAIIEKIKDCLEIQIKKEKGPKIICSKCCMKLEEFYTFKQFCRNADRKLQEILENFHKCSMPESNFVKIETDNVDYKISQNSEDVGGYDQLSNKSKIETDPENDGLDDFHDDRLLLENHIDVDTENTIEIVKKKVKKKTNSVTTPRNNKNSVRKSTYKPKRSASYCNICRKDFESKENLATHNATNHGVENENTFKCFGCEKRFKSRKSRLGHEKTFCKGLKDGYKCRACDRFLPNRSMYEMHMRDHRENSMVELPESIFQCTKCFELFKTKLSLTEHLATHDSEMKLYVCETCGRVFTRHDYLNKHKLTHSGTKQHVCPHCGFRATQRSSLTMHIRKHTGERPYVCALCPQRCISSSNLRAHTRRHLGQKNFQCTICSKKFGYKISLEEHIASKHERSLPYSCEDCGAIYTRRRSLQRHLLAKHGKRVKNCQNTIKDGASCVEKRMGDDTNFLVENGSVVENKNENELKINDHDVEFVLLNTDSNVLITKMF